MVSDAQHEQVLELARQGVGRNAIARETGLGAATVTRIVREAGLSFDRSGTATAVQARKIDLAEKRSQLELDYLRDAQRLRRLLWKPHTYFDTGTFSESERTKDSTTSRTWTEFVTFTTPTPTAQDQERLMRASVTAAQQSQRISDAASGADVDAAKSMLAGLFEQLGGAWRAMQAEEATSG